MDADQGDELQDHWEFLTDQLTTLATKFRHRYQEVAGDGGPTEEEVRAALRTLGQAMDRVAVAIGQATRDPQVREQIKKTAGVLGASIGSAWEELRRSADADTESDDETGSS